MLLALELRQGPALLCARWSRLSGRDEAPSSGRFPSGGTAPAHGGGWQCSVTDSEAGAAQDPPETRSVRRPCHGRTRHRKRQDVLSVQRGGGTGLARWPGSQSSWLPGDRLEPIPSSPVRPPSAGLSRLEAGGWRLGGSLWSSPSSSPVTPRDYCAACTIPVSWGLLRPSGAGQASCQHAHCTRAEARAGGAEAGQGLKSGAGPAGSPQSCDHRHPPHRDRIPRAMQGAIRIPGSVVPASGHIVTVLSSRTLSEQPNQPAAEGQTRDG